MKRTVLWAFLVGAALVGQVLAQPALNDVPSRVVGQPSVDFRSTNPNVVEGREFFSPIAVVVDRSSTPQALFVSDFGNNRVFGWSNAASFANGAPADVVIGQLDKVSTQPLGPGSGRATGLAFPGALAVDSRGNLYVADLGNNRILRFPKPFAVADEVKSPDMVIGQPNFNSDTANQGLLSERGLAFNLSGNVRTAGLAFDPQGNLWVSDPGNNRVLRYPVAALTAGTNQPAADLVLGQPNFTTNAAPPANAASRVNKSVLSAPSGVAVDSVGNVFVADALSRAVVYTPPFFNGKDASRLLGVAILTPGESITNATNFANPEGVFVVGDRVGVTDTALNRILIFDALKDWPAETEQQPSPAAKIVIGQADFTSNRPNRQGTEASVSSLAAPQSGFYNGTELFVADTSNHRVVVYPQVVSDVAATRELGQANFNLNAVNRVEGNELFLYSGFSANSNLSGDFSDGSGVALDNRSNPPRLYIADTFNNRVLGYRDARKVKPGDKADIVIGQADFSRVMINAPQNNRDIQTDQGLFRPSGLVVDSNGDLFVADSGNGRVLRFASPFERVPGGGERYRANLVIGQANAFSRIIDPGPRNMAYPFGLAFTADGHLLVSDAVHHRVLFFRRPQGGDFTTGMAAEKVIGQPDFFTGTRGTGNNRLNSPRHVAIDTDDRLYVADPGNGRIVMYDRIPFASNDPAPAFGIAGISSPQGVYVSPRTGEIWVTNTRGGRVSRFPRFALLPITTAPEQNIASNVPLALTQDASGNLYVAEGGNRIALFFNGLVHQIAGSFSERPISPGGIAILYPRSQSSRRFSEETKSFNELPNPVPLPKELVDTQVLLNDQPVPLYFVSPGQINFLVPMQTPESGQAQVQVIRPSTGEIIAASGINLSRVSPGLFIQGSSDQGQIAALNQDNSVNDAGNPAARLSVVQLFAAGQGVVANAPADGDVAQGPLPTDEKPLVLLGTRFVDEPDVLYSGLAPGLVGVWQINVRIPDFVAPASQVDLVVQFKSVPSNVGSGGKRLRTTIAVRP